MSVMNAARTLGVESGWTLSNITMQKTLYVAQMLHIGRTGEPIFPEPFEAWDFGPVVPDLYHVVKRFRAGRVEDIFADPAFDRESTQAQCIRDAYSATRHMSAGQLVSYTHRQGGAWEAYYRQGCRGSVIPLEAILQEWKSATKPSRDAIAWAEEMADDVEARPGKYLDPSNERAFRARVFGQNLQ